MRKGRGAVFPEKDKVRVIWSFHAVRRLKRKCKREKMEKIDEKHLNRKNSQSRSQISKGMRIGCQIQ